jgi:hypothetical protein
MPVGFTAIELEAAIDDQHRLHLDASLPGAAPGPVRVLVLIPSGNDPDESEWLRYAAANPAFDFLEDPAEDIYSPTDGKPYHGQG